MEDVLNRMAVTAQRSKTLTQTRVILVMLEETGVSPSNKKELLSLGINLQEKGVVEILKDCFPATGLSRHLSNLEQVAGGSGNTTLLKDFLRHAEQELERLQP